MRALIAYSWLVNTDIYLLPQEIARSRGRAQDSSKLRKRYWPFPCFHFSAPVRRRIKSASQHLWMVLHATSELHVILWLPAGLPYERSDVPLVAPCMKLQCVVLDKCRGPTRFTTTTVLKYKCKGWEITMLPTEGSIYDARVSKLSNSCALGPTLPPNYNVFTDQAR